ncbi:unnamed protein product [Ostreobium quekettii]|uniref:Uncharacterized protein n=1 Tax=Ostreobium quekettii TaxID=121088 RepID=A0A8S1J5G8_9CHLO|nr:unnamed protein product [Ostreobium quekettii]
MATLLWALQSVIPLDPSLLTLVDVGKVNTAGTRLLGLLPLCQLVMEAVARLLPQRHVAASGQGSLPYSDFTRQRLEAGEQLLLQGCTSADHHDRCCAVLCMAGWLNGLQAWRGVAPDWVLSMALRLRGQLLDLCHEADIHSQLAHSGSRPLGQPHDSTAGMQSNSALLEHDAAVDPSLLWASLYRACLGIAVARAVPVDEVVQRREASAEALAFTVTALLDFCLPLDGIFVASQRGFAPGAANAWLMAHAQGALEAETWTLTRMTAALGGAAPGMEAFAAMQRFRDCATRLHREYSAYLLGTDEGWMQEVNGQMVGRILSRMFHCCVSIMLEALQNTDLGEQEAGHLPQSPPLNDGTVPLSAVTGRSALEASAHAILADHGTHRPDRAQLQVPGTVKLASAKALVSLDLLAHLQFCRTASSEYALLVQKAIACAAASPDAATSTLALLPDYVSLVAPIQGEGTPGVWNSDQLLASRMVFLMRVLPAALHAFVTIPPEHRRLASPSVDSASQRGAACIEFLAPYAFLYLHHQDASARTSAHTFFRALVEAASSCGVPYLVEDLAPFYVHRCMDSLRLLHWEPFSLCVASILNKLPKGSSVAGQCISCISSAAQALAVDQPKGSAEEAEVQQSNGPRSTGISVPASEGDWEDGERLFEVLCRCLLWVSPGALGETMDIIERSLVGLGSERATERMETLYRIVSGNRDYTRRLPLARWHLRLKSRVLSE